MIARKTLTTLLWGSLLTTAAYAWLLYVPFVRGTIPGIYPLAWIYSYALSRPAFYIVLFYPISIAVTIAVFASSAWFNRRHKLFPRICQGGLAFLILCLGLYPTLWYSFEKGPSVEIDSWKQTYRIAFSHNTFEEVCLTSLVMSCDSTGLLCKIDDITSASFVNKTDLNFSYSHESDRLSLRLPDHVLYERNRDGILTQGIGRTCLGELLP